MIADTGADTSTVEVTTLEKAPSPVQKASFDTGGEPRLDARATARFLATSQAARVREQLVGQGGLSPGLVKILPPSYPVNLSTAESDLPQHRMIAIRLSPSEMEPLKQADTP